MVPAIPPVPPAPLGPKARARLAGKRGRLLLRAWWKGRELRALRPLRPLARDAIPCLAVVRNEAARLPHWLAHHRRLGVDRFLLVDNGSTDGTRELLEREPDVALWGTGAGYRASRFGVDWVNALLARHGAGRWVLVLDADELLVFPRWEERGLRGLVRHLDGAGLPGLPCLMVELYPKGPVARAPWSGDPLADLPWFDPGGYRARRQARHGCLLVQGGPRDRVLFAHDPGGAPTLSKVPLLRWRRGMAFVNSTHFALPPRVNAVLEGEGPSGALLHTKLGPDIVARSREEQARGEHFTDRARHRAYYDALAGPGGDATAEAPDESPGEGPDFWFEGSARYAGWEQLEALGLLRRGGWG